MTSLAQKRTSMLSMLAFLCFLPYVVVAESARDALTPIMNKLSTREVERYRFQQSKSIKALSRPLVSEGRMVFSKSQGLLWQIETPRSSTFIITAGRIERREGTTALSKVTTEENPAVEGFTKVFMSLFRGDLDSLEQAFNVIATGDGTKWKLTLRPKGPQTARFLDEIVLLGDERITQLRVSEKGGDISQIDFKPETAGAAALTKAEEAYFTSEQ